VIQKCNVEGASSDFIESQPSYINCNVSSESAVLELAESLAVSQHWVSEACLLGFIQRDSRHQLWGKPGVLLPLLPACRSCTLSPAQSRASCTSKACTKEIQKTLR